MFVHAPRLQRPGSQPFKREPTCYKGSFSEGGGALPLLPSSPYSLHHHLPELGVAEPSVAVGVEPGKDLLDLLLRQVLRELLHLRLGDVAVLVLGEQTHMTSIKFSGFTPLLLVRIW